MLKHVDRDDLLHNISRKDVLIQLIDSFRLRLDSFRFHRVVLSPRVKKDKVLLIKKCDMQFIKKDDIKKDGIQLIEEKDNQLIKENIRRSQDIQRIEEEMRRRDEEIEEDIHEEDNQIIASARLHRVVINPKVKEDAEKDFRTFLDLAESTDGLLPSWWNAKERSKCEALGNKQNGYSSIHKTVSKADFIEHYGDDIMVPIQLKALRDKVYRNWANGLFLEKLRKWKSLKVGIAAEGAIRV